jgi:type III secretory pathway component EscS
LVVSFGGPGSHYASLGPGGTIAAFLRERNLLRISIGLIVVMVVGFITWRWVRNRPQIGEAGVALGIAAVYLIAWVRIPIPEERTHLIEYSLVAILIYLALAERQQNGSNVHAPSLGAIIATAVLGLLDEIIQAILPERVFDIIDVGFNAGAGLMAVLAILILAWARRRGNQILNNRGQRSVEY